MSLSELTQRALDIRQKYSELERKRIGREWTNQELMEGFVGDVGDLMKIVMAKEGTREIEGVDEKLKHELADCLWCILVLSSKYNIDLEKSFLETMAQLDQNSSSKL